MSNKPKLKATIYDKRGRILSVGYNSYTKTHPLQARYDAKYRGTKGQCGSDPTSRRADTGVREAGRATRGCVRPYLHAEIQAIARCKRLDKAVRIFVERYGRDGTPRLARPCEVCELAIKDTGIGIVEYTTYEV